VCLVSCFLRRSPQVVATSTVGKDFSETVRTQDFYHFRLAWVEAVQLCVNMTRGCSVERREKVEESETS
jgi:hypothetical protein